MSKSTEEQVQQSNVWIKSHVYSEPLVEGIRMSVGGVEANFSVFARIQKHPTNGHYYWFVSVTTEEPVDYVINYSFVLPGNEKPKFEDWTLTRIKSTSGLHIWEIADPSKSLLVLELVFKEIQYRQLYPLPDAGLLAYIERGPRVLLIGSDGKVSVPMRALEIRSETFETMFKYRFKMMQTLKIKLKDFDCNTLDAFSYFLATGRIKNGKETALGLILLADKYDIEDMKVAAEKFVTDNFDAMEPKNVLDTFSKVGCGSLEQAMKRAWSRSDISRSDPTDL